MAPSILTFDILERVVEIACGDPQTRRLLDGIYGGFRPANLPAHLSYKVGKSESGVGYSIEREAKRVRTDDADEFVTKLGDDITIESQKLRPDLYFVHAAVVESGGRAILLSATAGQGKSTTTWALLHHGFRFLSDELAPVDLDSLEAHPFPRAISLKSPPPEPYALVQPVRTETRVIHVPANELPGDVAQTPVPLGAIIFVRHDPAEKRPSLERLEAARAAMMLYANALNPLAHRGDGLDGALRIVECCESFELVATDLRRTAALIRSAIQEPATE